MIGPPVLRHRRAAHEAVGRTQRETAHLVVAELVLHFERQLARLHRGSAELDAVAAAAAPLLDACESSFTRDVQRVVDVRQRLGRELDVDDVAEHLDDLSGTAVSSNVAFWVAVASFDGRWSLDAQRLRAADDFQEFLGDRRLARVVHLRSSARRSASTRCRSRWSSRRAARRRTRHRFRASRSRS